MRQLSSVDEAEAVSWSDGVDDDEGWAVGTLEGEEVLVRIDYCRWQICSKGVVQRSGYIEEWMCDRASRRLWRPVTLEEQTIRVAEAMLRKAASA